MIKVLHILQDINSGGVERRRLSIAKKLNTEDFELKIVCIKALKNIPDEIRSYGVEVIPLETFGGIFDWKSHKKIQKIIDDFKPHIIHGAVFEGVTLAAINGFIKRVPYIIIEETSDPVNRSWRGDLLMKLFSILAHYSVGVSHSAYDYLKNKLKIPQRKLKLIVNGVKSANQYTDQELQELKNNLGILNTDFVFITAGRINTDPHKRFHVLIDNFAKVAVKYPHAKLIMMGEGNMVDEYKKLTEKLNIQNQVIFTGYQSNVDKFFAISNVFCLFSGSEAFGLVSVEAQMNKIPAIVTNVGGLKYTVINDETGYVVGVHDYEVMTQKMEHLLLNPEKTKAMGLKAFDNVNANFHEDTYTSSLFNFYYKIMSK